MSDEIDAAVDRLRLTEHRWDRFEPSLRAELLAAEQRGAAADRSEPVPTMGTGTDPRGCFPRAVFDSTPQPSRATQRDGISLREARESALRVGRESDKRLHEERLREAAPPPEPEQGGGVLAHIQLACDDAKAPPGEPDDRVMWLVEQRALALTRLRDAAQRARGLLNVRWDVEYGPPPGWSNAVRDFLRELAR